MARPRGAEAAGRLAIRVDRRSLLRLAAGFAAGLVVWLVFAAPYERSMAAASEALLRAFENPPVTRLEASRGEIIVDRADFPEASPRPGLPAGDLHFNFVLLCALFAMTPRPLSPGNFGRFWAAAALLWVVHVLALVVQIESVYATRLGPWSEAHYGAVARNLWGGGFHFYLIAGRFAAPFALWWALSGVPGQRSQVPGRGSKM
jgi:hypothetical protein